MRALLLLSALLLPPRAAAASTRPPISVRADTDSVIAVGILKDLAAAFEEVANRNGYHMGEKIEGWPELPYVASASGRPDVAEYFAHRQAYAVDLSAHMDSIAAIVVKRRLDAAGYPVLEGDSMRTAFLVGFHKNAAKQQVLFDAMRRQCRVALTLHAFLVKIDPHVRLDPKSNKLVFDRPADKRRFDELAIAVDAANDLMDQAASASQGGSSAPED